MASLAGQKIDRYEVLEKVGEGGMATVYKALDTRLEREVALKIIRREAFPPDQLEMVLKRFEREAKSLARLSHPNIVSVMDYGEYEGSPYLVMMYLPGGTLKAKLGKPIFWRDAVEMILPIAQALEYVHEHNIINRDVKPSNILLTEKNQPMLTDFGLVKLFENQDTNLTASGTGIGTPDYMAPEQWTGDATALSDMYSLGVVLYEMITAHRPYMADTPAGVLLKQISDPLPLPNQYIPDLPRNIESVLLKVLARKPEDRYSNMHAFINELQILLAGKDPLASSIKTETLRDQMTGKVKKQEIQETQKKIAEIKQAQAAQPFVPPVQPPPPSPALQPKPFAAQPVKKKSNVPLIVAGLGVLVIFFLCAGCWLVYANLGLFRALPTPTRLMLPSPTTFVLPTDTALSPTLPPATSAPTETPPPTVTSMPAEISDAHKILMRLVPGGEFTMGSENGDPDAHPEGLVNVDTFYIDKYLVSNEMYAACVNDGKCRRPLQAGSMTRSSYYGEPKYATFPVIFVTWQMAKTYCEWRDARLPTEAEWEKAARGTDGRPFPWGNGAFSCALANHFGCVGDTSSIYDYEKGQSPYGVYGMSGNVWQWTSSLYKIYPYDSTDGREDPGGAGKRVVRGGSWYFFGSTGSVYTYTRFKVDPSYYGVYVGFRCMATK